MILILVIRFEVWAIEVVVIAGFSVVGLTIEVPKAKVKLHFKGVIIMVRKQD